MVLRRIRHVMVVLAFVAISPPAFAADDMALEQVVLVYRHGVRSPLPGEIQVDEVHGRAWPAWPVPPSILTSHGREGVMAMGRFDRQWLSGAGLFPSRGCPVAGSVGIWANTDQRTIASAQALADAFAPGCGLKVGHLPQGTADPVFNPVASNAVEWDGHAALATIQRETKGPDALTAQHRDAMSAFGRVMGCVAGDSQSACVPATWHGTLALGADGKGIALDGPIADTSGTSEAIIMAYLEGKPMADVGWGRVDAATFHLLSQLHSLLFDVHARPSYVADRVAAVLSGRILAILDDPHAPRLNVFVGSDNNIVALVSVLGMHFEMPGYGKDDPPVGGALGITVWRSRSDGHRIVRVVYQAQTPDQLRYLRPLTKDEPPARQELVPEVCKASLSHCDLDKVLDVLRRSAAHRRG
jgi:4-phytase/acid phosphatase